MSVDTALLKTKAILEKRGQEYGDADILFNKIADRFSLVLNRKIDKYTAARLLVELKLLWLIRISAPKRARNNPRDTSGEKDFF